MADASKPHDRTEPADGSADAAAKAISRAAALAHAVPILEAAGIADPLREAALILRHVQPEGSLAYREASAPRAAFEAAVARRAAREPMAFITGTKGFWTLDLAVSRETLIPRPDSETLVEAALAAFPPGCPPARVLDLGTGTGCLLLAALSEFPGAFGIGVDLNPAAARLAATNACQCGLAARTAFLAADWSACMAGEFDLILCNPPYIGTGDMAGLMPEVGEHEPLLALDGGASGLEAYSALMPQVADLLSLRGRAVFELGAGQEKAVVALAQAAGLAHVTTNPDLGGIARALVVGLPVTEKTFGRTQVAR